MTCYGPAIKWLQKWWLVTPFKVEYHAHENPLKHSEKIAYVGQGSMYPIMKKKPYHASFFFNVIKFLGFYIKNSSF